MNNSQVGSINGNVFRLLLKNRDQLPPLRFDCGKVDLLIEYNRSLHQAFASNSIKHAYQDFEGAHEWSYWQEHIKDSLLFINQF